MQNVSKIATITYNADRPTTNDFNLQTTHTNVRHRFTLQTTGRLSMTCVQKGLTEIAGQDVDGPSPGLYVCKAVVD